MSAEEMQKEKNTNPKLRSNREVKMQERYRKKENNAEKQRP